MFRFTSTIIRELQPALCQSYSVDSNILVVVGVFSIMAAYVVRSAIRGPVLKYMNNLK